MKYKELSDEFLASLAQQNDAEAMETLILRYRYLVTAIAHSYFLVDGDVEDLIQVGQIGVFKAITTYKGKAEFKFYAFKCVKNSVLSAIKKSTTYKHFALNNAIPLAKFVEGDNDKNILLADLKFDPVEKLINTESEEELLNSIKNNLSSYENEILSLYLQGYTYVEIADRLSKKPKSIDNALQRIKKKLLLTLGQVG